MRPLRGAVAPTQGGAQRAHVGVETGCDALSWARAIGHQPRLGPCMLVGGGSGGVGDGDDGGGGNVGVEGGREM